MSNKTSSALHSAVDLGSIPMAQGGLARLAVARLEGAGVPMVPLLRACGADAGVDGRSGRAP